LENVLTVVASDADQVEQAVPPASGGEGNGSPLRVLLVAKDASLKFGGESARPFHYFRVMRERGVDVRLLVHARTRDELHRLLPGESDRMYFVPDTWFHKFIAPRGKWLPGQMRYMLFDTPSI